MEKREKHKMCIRDSLYSRKKNMYFEADLHMDADETGKVNFSLSFPKKKPDVYKRQAFYGRRILILRIECTQ